MSNCEYWQSVSKNKSKTKSKNKSKTQYNKQKQLSNDEKIAAGEYYGEPTKWTVNYNCEKCNCLLSKKNLPRYPQIIYNCNHLVCAKCIGKSYLVDMNPFCPVPNCGKCINPNDEITFGQKTNSIEICKHCNDKRENCICDLLYTNYRVEISADTHYCGDWLCTGDCGMLTCGCVNVCFGHCVSKNYYSRY